MCTEHWGFIELQHVHWGFIELQHVHWTLRFYWTAACALNTEVLLNCSMCTEHWGFIELQHVHWGFIELQHVHWTLRFYWTAACALNTEVLLNCSMCTEHWAFTCSWQIEWGIVNSHKNCYFQFEECVSLKNGWQLQLLLWSVSIKPLLLFLEALLCVKLYRHLCLLGTTWYPFTLVKGDVPGWISLLQILLCACEM